MTTLTLGKVKFVNRGTYAIANTYSKGDIVQYASQSYIYKNDTSKSYSPLFLDTSYAGTISTMKIGRAVLFRRIAQKKVFGGSCYTFLA